MPWATACCWRWRLGSICPPCNPTSFSARSCWALVWFTAHKITCNCTLVDDEADASGQGLMQSLPRRTAFTPLRLAESLKNWKLKRRERRAPTPSHSPVWPQLVSAQPASGTTRHPVPVGGSPTETPAKAFGLRHPAHKFPASGCCIIRWPPCPSLVWARPCCPPETWPRAIGALSTCSVISPPPWACSSPPAFSDCDATCASVIWSCPATSLSDGFNLALWARRWCCVCPCYCLDRGPAKRGASCAITWIINCAAPVNMPPGSIPMAAAPDALAIKPRPTASRKISLRLPDRRRIQIKAGSESRRQRPGQSAHPRAPRPTRAHPRAKAGGDHPGEHAPGWSPPAGSLYPWLKALFYLAAGIGVMLVGLPLSSRDSGHAAERLDGHPQFPRTAAGAVPSASAAPPAESADPRSAAVQNVQEPLPHG